MISKKALKKLANTMPRINFYPKALYQDFTFVNGMLANDDGRLPEQIYKDGIGKGIKNSIEIIHEFRQKYRIVLLRELSFENELIDGKVYEIVILRLFVERSELKDDEMAG